MKKITIGLICLLLLGIFIAGCTASETEEPVPTATSAPQPTLAPPTETTVLDDLSAIRLALAEYLGVAESELQVSDATIEGDYARGGVENGYFLAVKVGPTWEVVYAGQATPTCEAIEPYDFPLDMVPECLGVDNSLVDRTAQDVEQTTTPTVPSEEQAILEAVAAHIGKDLANIKASVDRMQDDIAMGSVESGYFLAAKEGGKWIIVHDGQTTPTCEAIEPYDFPVEWVPECIGEGDTLVDRSKEAESTETPTPDELAILEALAENLGIDVDDLQASVTEVEDQVAIGSVENGYFLAAKSDGEWIIVYAGQATPACSAVDPYGFSADMVPECLDEDNNLVQRSDTSTGKISDTLGPPDWKDNLNSSANWYLVETDNVEFSMGEGVLEMKVKRAGGYEEWGMATVPQLDDIYLEAEFETGDTCSGKDRYGLLFRSPDPSMGYVYEFSCDGRYRIYRWDGSNYVPLKEWTSSGLIKSGPNQVNSLGVMAVGDVFELYANGQYLGEVSDDAFEVGRFGLLIGSENTNNLIVYVDSVAYWFVEQ